MFVHVRVSRRHRAKRLGLPASFGQFAARSRQSSRSVRRVAEQHPHLLALSGFPGGEIRQGRGQQLVKPIPHNLDDQELGERLSLDRIVCSAVFEPPVGFLDYR